MNQDTIEIVNQVFQVCVIPLLGILTGYLIKFLRNKSEQIQSTTDNALVKQYIQLGEKAVIDAVIATNQTFVESMKNQNVFDEAAQKVAFNMTKDAVLKSLSQSSKEMLTQIYGDFDAWINMAIEKAVNENKVVVVK